MASHGGGGGGFVNKAGKPGMEPIRSLGPEDVLLSYNKRILL